MERRNIRLTQRGKQPGIDGETKQSYGENLEANLEQLSERLARMGWKPKPVRRVYIPKPASSGDSLFRRQTGAVGFGPSARTDL